MKRRAELFEQLGGPEVGALARRRFLESDGMLDEAGIAEWRRLAMPLYVRKPLDPDMMRRAIIRPDVLQWWTRPGNGESRRFDMMADLSRIACPTLVMGGEDDPMHPVELQADIAAALPAHLVRFERFAGCGHGVVPDAGEAAMRVIREFVVS